METNIRNNTSGPGIIVETIDATYTKHSYQVIERGNTVAPAEEVELSDAACQALESAGYDVVDRENLSRKRWATRSRKEHADASDAVGDVFMVEAVTTVAIKVPLADNETVTALETDRGTLALGGEHFATPDDLESLVGHEAKVVDDGSRSSGNIHERKYRLVPVIE
ncbi:hypothetical protein JMJ58_05355 [Haloterrigena salifodinae]|uniref:Uncharacterized protein n=1 Tax=Haloterrigena salifodinae TaxID=2675099 RepID=A0A8T8E494_9EURY|nr:hypothetical protein [Haloterrigena salifodinae]QRV16320.1 hypothetical protein JMJ58_05355 [Haloterrigena salifodinae]